MERLLEILQDISPDTDFTACDKLIDEGVLDSFSIISLVAELDDEYDIEIGAEELVPENFNSAERIYNMVQRLVDEG
jgi:acyl carrier protein